MKPFARIARYTLRYKLPVLTGLLCSVGYGLTNAFSMYLIGPFMETIFIGNKPAAENVQQAVPGASFLDEIQASVHGLFDDVMDYNDQRQALSHLCLLIIAAILVKNVFSYFQGYIMAYVEQGMVRNLREDIYAAYHRLPLRFFQKRKTGDMISRVINDCNTINENLNNALISLMKESWRMSFLNLVPGILNISQI